MPVSRPFGDVERNRPARSHCEDFFLGRRRPGYSVRRIQLQHGPHQVLGILVELVRHGRHHTEGFPTTTAKGEEEVHLLAWVGDAEGAVGRHEFHLQDVVDGQPEGGAYGRLIARTRRWRPLRVASRPRRCTRLASARRRLRPMERHPSL